MHTSKQPLLEEQNYWKKPPWRLLVDGSVHFHIKHNGALRDTYQIKNNGASRDIYQDCIITEADTPSEIRAAVIEACKKKTPFDIARFGRNLFWINTPFSDLMHAQKRRFEPVMALSPSTRCILESELPEKIAQFAEFPYLQGVEFEYPGVHRAAFHMWRALMKTPRRTYIIVGPSGSGKSTMGLLLRINGFRYLPKLTTRTARPGERNTGETVCISDEEFRLHANRGALALEKESYSHKYGVLHDTIGSIDDRPHMLCLTDMKSAVNLRKQYPSIVRIAALQPTILRPGIGLEHRIESLKANVKADENTVRKTLQDTASRMKTAPIDHQRSLKEASHADYILRENHPFDNAKKLMDIAYSPLTHEADIDGDPTYEPSPEYT